MKRLLFRKEMDAVLTEPNPERYQVSVPPISGCLFCSICF